VAEITCCVLTISKKGANIMQTQTATNVFKGYKVQLETAVTQYNKLAESYPDASFPTLARQIWRSGMLAEMWATIATLLSKEGVNYLHNWREGK
jgi:hypothetical protein